MIPIQQPRKILTLAAVLAVAVGLSFGGASMANAAKSKSTENEAEWISFDAATNKVKVKITRKGRGPNRKMIKKGDEVTFNVKPEGSVLTRTVVKINGQKADLEDLTEGKTVLIRWVPDEGKDGEYFIRGIDAILSDEELDARYGTE